MDSRLEQYFASLGINDPWLDGWAVSVGTRNGEDIGFTLVRGCEIHILPIVEKRALSRKNIRDAIQPILDKYGYVTTRVPIAVEDHRLRERLGFTFTWADDRFSYWALTEIPYQKEES